MNFRFNQKVINFKGFIVKQDLLNAQVIVRKSFILPNN